MSGVSLVGRARDSTRTGGLSDAKRRFDAGVMRAAQRDAVQLPGAVAGTRRVHQSSYRRPRVLLALRVIPALATFSGIAEHAKSPSHGGNPGSNPGSGTKVF